MAAFVQTRLISAYDPSPQTPLQRMMRALQNQDTYAEAALRKVSGLPQFEIFGTTDTNTAAASSPVINLSDSGVIFPANTIRTIEVRTEAFNGSNRYTFCTRQHILGGTDPTLMGPEQWITSTRACLTATLASGTPTVVAAETFGPAWWSGAAPTAGAFSSGDSVVTWLGTNSPVRALTPLAGIVAPTSPDVTDAIVTLHNVTSLTNGTSTVATGTYEGTEAEENPADGRIVVEAILYPPVHTPVLIDTGSTPDEVFIGALGISSDVVTWHISVFVGDLVSYGPLV